MDEKRFWEIIDFACQGKWIILAPQGEDDNAWDEFRWYRPLLTALKKLAPEDIVRFQHLFDQKMNAIYTWDHWGAMHLLTGSESDNRFAFFRSWLVCMGKKVYEAALENPDSLANVVDPTWEHDYTPGFCAPGDNAWDELCLKREDFDAAYAPLGKREIPQITGLGWPCDITSAMLIRRYPRLAALYGLASDYDVTAEQERMREHLFWDIIGRACSHEHPKEGTWADQWAEPLFGELAKLQPQDIVRFDHWLSVKSDALYTERHLDAGRLINAGVQNRNNWGDGDEVYDFRDWIVGMGKEIYEAALADPDTLASVVDPTKNDYEADIGLVPFKAWERLGLPEHDYWASCSEYELRDRNLGYQSPERKREEWNRYDLAEWRKRYPRLATPYGLHTGLFQDG